MPLFGLGVYLAEEGAQTEDAVTFALKNGYRLIDTAQYYRFVKPDKNLLHTLYVM